MAQEREHGCNPTVGRSHRTINLRRTGEGPKPNPALNPEGLVEELNRLQELSRRARRLFNRG